MSQLNNIILSATFKTLDGEYTIIGLKGADGKDGATVDEVRAAIGYNITENQAYTILANALNG